MADMAPLSGLSLAALTRFSAGLPLPQAAAAPDKQPRVPDVVVFSSAPMRVLSDLASAGLRQLAALLPMIEQAVQEDSPAALGHLAKAAGAAARQIGDGHEALLSEGADRVAASMQRQLPIQNGMVPVAVSDTKQLLRTLARQIGAEAGPADDGRASEPLRTIARQIGAATDQLDPRSPAGLGAGPLQRWISEAKHLLRSTGDALERAEGQLQPPPAVEPTNLVGAPPTTWLLAEIQAAQVQIAAAYAAVSQPRTTARISYRVAPRAFSLDHLSGATTLLGMAIILTTLWIVGGLWSAAAGSIALCGAAMWAWRISQATRGVTLDGGS